MKSVESKPELHSKSLLKSIKALGKIGKSKAVKIVKSDEKDNNENRTSSTNLENSFGAKSCSLYDYNETDSASMIVSPFEISSRYSDSESSTYG